MGSPWPRRLRRAAADGAAGGHAVLPAAAPPRPLPGVGRRPPPDSGAAGEGGCRLLFKVGPLGGDPGHFGSGQRPGGKNRVFIWVKKLRSHRGGRGIRVRFAVEFGIRPGWRVG